MSSPALIQHVAERAVAHLKDCFDNALDILTYCPACGKPMCESTVHLVDLQPTEVLAFSICGPCDDRSRAGKPLKAHSKWLSSAPAYLRFSGNLRKLIILKTIMLVEASNFLCLNKFRNNLVSL